MANLIKIFWKRYYKEVEEYRQEKCAKYCFICGDNCCNGRLNPSFYDIRPFSHLKRVRYRWDVPPEKESYIIDRRFFCFGGFFLVRECPYLNDGLCKLYSDPIRPKECYEYPMYLDVPLQIPFFKPFISVEMSCTIFSYEKNRSEVEEFARNLGLGIIFHPPYEE